MAKRIKFVKFRDILSIFLLIIAFFPAMLAKIFIRDFWLVCEDENEARDNGYWFFKYVCENHKDQKIAYAIHKKAPDYNKVKNLGKVIEYGSLSHWFWYLVADKNISSQKGGKPNKAVCYLFEVVFKMRKNNRIFLQHGIIISDLEFLYFKNTNMKRFVVSTYQEEKFLNEKFGYPEGNVVLTGLCRFDNLNDAVADKKQILVMPTWRQWIAKGVETKAIEGTDVFEETNYFKNWQALLKNAKIEQILEKYDKNIVFYPHRNMQKYLDKFSVGSKRIKLAHAADYDVQQLLKSSALLITDYSSVFFDFAYLKKPIIFYQFDYDAFRKNQYGEGYFDYKHNKLGDWTESADGVAELLEEFIKRDMEKKDKDAVDEYFPYTDSNNCERTYKMIKEMK